ncbi:MAG: SBBP repeat-containing protein, partial [Desulfuromonadales bacterium]
MSRTARRWTKICGLLVVLPWMFSCNGGGDGGDGENGVSPPAWGGTLLEGGPANDSVADGEVDSAGNIYLIGSTSSDLFETNQGNRDIFVASYDAGGILRWGIQFGDAGDDRG